MVHLVQTNNEFSRLDASSWTDVTKRHLISREAISTSQYNGDITIISGMNLEDYESAWSVLQAVSMDPTYIKPTTYNLFTLLDLGNKFSKQQPVSHLNS
jgi:hypothetical protein